MTRRDPDELIRLGQLIDVALDVPPAERKVLLERACGTDQALFDTVWRMLVDLDRADSFLETPVVQSLPLLYRASANEVLDLQDYPTPVSRKWDVRRLAGRTPQDRARRGGAVRRYAPAISIAAIALIVLTPIGVRWSRQRATTTTAASFDTTGVGGPRRERDSSPARAPGGSLRPEGREVRRQVELARTQMQHNAYDSAEVDLRHAMALFTAAGDETSLAAADARFLLATALQSKSHFVEAERELRAALHVYRLALDANDRRLVEVLGALASLLEKSGRQAEADSLRNSGVGRQDSAPQAPYTTERIFDR